MSKETKISLLIGLFAILTIGIFVSDHLSETKKLPIADVAVSSNDAPPPPAPMANDNGATSNSNASLDNGLPLPPPGDVGSNNNPAARTIPIPAAEPREVTTPSDLRNIDRSADGNASTFSNGNANAPSGNSSRPGDQDNLTTGRLPRPMPPIDNNSERLDTPPANNNATEVANNTGNPGNANGATGNNSGAGSTGINLTNPKVHFVAKGETLSSIARKHLGSDRYSDAIFQANKSILRSPTSICVGTRLIIPEKIAPATRTTTATNPPTTPSTPPTEARPATPAETAPEFPRTPIHARPRTTIAESTPVTPATPTTPTIVPTSATPGRTVEYTVKEGDTLWGIASRVSGSGKLANKIVELNKDRLRNANKLKEGLVLRVPAKSDR